MLSITYEYPYKTLVSIYFTISNNFNLLCSSVLPENLDGLEDPKFHFSDKEYLSVYREEIHNDNNFKTFVTAYNPVCQ